LDSLAAAAPLLLIRWGAANWNSEVAEGLISDKSRPPLPPTFSGRLKANALDGAVATAGVSCVTGCVICDRGFWEEAKVMFGMAGMVMDDSC